jgi:hypothetical protein
MALSVNPVDEADIVAKIRSKLVQAVRLLQVTPRVPRTSRRVRVLSAPCGTPATKSASRSANALKRYLGGENHRLAA